MKKMIKVTGLDCGHCAAEFEKIIKNAEGYKYKVISCIGEEISKGEIEYSLQEIRVPTSAIIFLNK